MRLGWTGTAFAAAALLSGGGHGGHAATGQVDDLAGRFATAPEVAPDHQQLAQIEVNGVVFGNQLIRVSSGRVALPLPTLRALGIAGGSGEVFNLLPETGITYRFDERQGQLSLTVPVSMLVSQRFAPDVGPAQVSLSPETWGAYVNYDVNLRHELGVSTSTSFRSVGSNSGARSSGLGALGGFADLRVLAPDVVGGFGWAYDSSRIGPDASVRLDSTLTWRPAWLNVAASVGDVVSTTPASLAQARPYRFGGLQVGTDYSGTPGWSSSPIPSVNGTAQAQSAIDVYLDGQRTFHTDTAGGPFSLVLPPGSTGVGTNVIVTDVTGRSVVIPVEVSRTDARLLRQGVFLWSAGLGAPRFAYGSAKTSYDRKLYGYANVRYGLFDAATATLHLEGGSGLNEAEGAADVAVTPWFTAHSSVAASRSARGVGGAGRFGVNVAGPWNLGLDVAAARTFGPFDDVVSVSGRSFGRSRGFSPLLSLPATSEVSARVSWQPNYRLSLSASYQANTYKGSASVGFASASASYLVAGRVPVFANISHAMGGQRATSLVAGVTFALGTTQVSASGGYGTGSGGASGTASRDAFSGGLAASHPLGEAVGDVGWDAFATRSPIGTFANADAQIRTGYAVPGVAVQSFGKQVTGYAILRGSAGVVGMHPFLSDPASGGIIIADAGRSGVPVQLNGYDKGRTSFDGKVALAGAVPGAPQRVAIDTAGMPIDAVPAETDHLVTVRDRGATLAAFSVHTATSSALLGISYKGTAPPVGSTLVSASSSAPISKDGRAYLPSIERDEVLTVEMPDGSKCLVTTRFDGRGGVGRRLGTLPCKELP